MSRPALGTARDFASIAAPGASQMLTANLHHLRAFASPSAIQHPLPLLSRSPGLLSAFLSSELPRGSQSNRDHAVHQQIVVPRAAKNGGHGRSWVTEVVSLDEGERCRHKAKPEVRLRRQLIPGCPCTLVARSRTASSRPAPRPMSRLGTPRAGVPATVSTGFARRRASALATRPRGHLTPPLSACANARKRPCIRKCTLALGHPEGNRLFPGCPRALRAAWELLEQPQNSSEALRSLQSALNV